MTRPATPEAPPIGQSTEIVAPDASSLNVDDLVQIITGQYLEIQRLNKHIRLLDSRLSGSGAAN